ncbi:MAG: tripartite tricarboxylate transporter substrate-binding protein [Proteobacteria bacterium]|nr:tripartite tricarboxylate transporter substrate-binding protein [Pseudomonadota bacterium]
MNRFTLSISAALSVAALALPVQADEVADFYKGNTVRFVIGAGAGGGYDLYSRTLVQHIASRIPGNPTILVTNMPGSGGVKASNYVYNAAAKNGTTLLMPFWTHPLFQLIRPRGIKFDMSKMHWIGNMAELNSAVTVMSKVATSWQDARNKEIIIAASGKGSETYIYPTLMNSLLGTKFKIVTGYSGTRNMTLAMEKGEADGRGGSLQSWSTIKPEWIANKTVTVIAQAGLNRDPGMKDTPLIHELVKPEDVAVAKLVSAPVTMARIVGFPPGASRAQVAAFRKAFDETMKDPKFLADATKRKMDLAPLSGAQVQANIDELMKTPKPILQRASKVLRY